jgi:hypothetical protein
MKKSFLISLCTEIFITLTCAARSVRSYAREFWSRPDPSVHVLGFVLLILLFSLPASTTQSLGFELIYISCSFKFAHFLQVPGDFHCSAWSAFGAHSF